MPHATGGLLRYWRGTVLGLMVGITSLLGHLAGHGDVAPVAALTVLGLALAGAGALAGRQLTPAALLPFVVGFQIAAHWLLTHGPAHAVDGSAGHSHGGIVDVAAGSRIWSAHPRPTLAIDGTATWMPAVDVQMMGCHALASVLIVGLAWRADAALFAFAAALRRAFDVIFRGPRWVGAPVATVAASALRPSEPAAPRHALSHPSPWRHRGPPAGQGRPRPRPCPRAPLQSEESWGKPQSHYLPA